MSKKISQLPSVTLPLNGEEGMVLIQNNKTVTGNINQLKDIIVTTDPNETTIRSFSGDWESMYTTVKSYSGQWDSNINPLQIYSNNWTNTYNTFKATSSNYILQNGNSFNGPVTIGTKNDKDFTINSNNSNNSNNLYIASTNVGIGTNNPQATLHLNSDLNGIDQQLYLGSNPTTFNNGTYFYIHPYDKVVIKNVQTSGTSYTINGNIAANGTTNRIPNQIVSNNSSIITNKNLLEENVVGVNSKFGDTLPFAYGNVSQPIDPSDIVGKTVTLKKIANKSLSATTGVFYDFAVHENGTGLGIDFYRPFISSGGFYVDQMDKNVVIRFCYGHRFVLHATAADEPYTIYEPYVYFRSNSGTGVAVEFFGDINSLSANIFASKYNDTVSPYTYKSLTTEKLLVKSGSLSSGTVWFTLTNDGKGNFKLWTEFKEYGDNLPISIYRSPDLTLTNGPSGTVADANGAHSNLMVIAATKRNFSPDTINANFKPKILNFKLINTPTI